jgi:hypothetical protein
LVVAWWTQMKTRVTYRHKMSYPTEKYNVIYPHWSRWTCGELAATLYKAWSPAERRNGAVMQVRGSVVIMMQPSVCPRLYEHGIGLTYFPTAISPVNMCSTNMRCISSEVLVLCILCELAPFSSWMNGTHLHPLSWIKPIYFFLCFSIRHRVLNHFVFNPLKTKRSHRDCRLTGWRGGEASFR